MWISILIYNKMIIAAGIFGWTSARKEKAKRQKCISVWTANWILRESWKYGKNN